MTKNKTTISACLLAFNEESVIERCLESLSGVVDEILIGHDGECSDNTLKIAKKYTDKIFILPHLGEAEPHRVFIIKKAKGDWILQIDPDEFLSDNLRKNLRKLTENTQVDAYEMTWPLWDGKKYITQTWPLKPILFRTSKLYYLGLPHEPLRTTGILAQSALVLDHQPTYNNHTWKAFFRKWVKWAKIQAHLQLEDFNDIPQYNITQTDWSPKLKLARRFSYLFPIIGMYTAFLNLKGGGYKNGWSGINQSLRWGLYNAVVYFYITIYKIVPHHGKT